MILPKTEGKSPWNAGEDEFRDYMKQYVLDNFSDLLGSKSALLNQKDGWDKLSKDLWDRYFGRNKIESEATNKQVA